MSRADGQYTSDTIAWLEDEWPHPAEAAALTVPEIDGDGAIVRAEMVLNGVDFRWRSSQSPGEDALPIYPVVLHEAGHWLGIGHSAEVEAIMYFAFARDGEDAVLHADDVDAVCAIYPLTPDDEEICGADDCHRPPPACASDAGCMADERCALGVCVPTLAPGEPLPVPAPNGSPCLVDRDCDSGACMPSQAGATCVPQCEHDADCALDLSCADARCAERNATTEAGRALPGSAAPASAGCSAAPGAGSGAVFAWLLLAWAAMRRRRARL